MSFRRVPRGSSAQAIAAMPARYCAGCGHRLERKTRASGQLETVAQFEARKTCGNTCKGAAIGNTLRTHRPPRARQAPKPPESPQQPESPKPPIALGTTKMQDDLRAARRAFFTTKNLLDTVLQERDEAQQQLTTLQADLTTTQETLAATARDLKRERAKPTVAPAELRKANTALESARAKLAAVTAERDQLRTDLRTAHAATLTIGTHDTGTAAAERDVALAELARIKAAQTLRPELLNALGIAAREHEELRALLAGNGKPDVFAPAPHQQPTHATERT